MLIKNEKMACIPGYIGLYSITSTGRVFSHSKTGGRFLKLFKTKNGYISVGLSKNKKRKTFLVHRLVGISFLPNPSCLPEINHKDGNKSNNLLTNLEWVSSSQNQKHAFNMGLQKISEKHRRSASITCRMNGLRNKGKANIKNRKLSDAQVAKIRQKLQDGFSSRIIANEFSVNKTTILNIKNNKTYKG